MSPAPPKGILVLPFSSLKAASPALAHPSRWHGVVPLTLEEFTYGFVNTFSPEDAAGRVREVRRPRDRPDLLRGGFANFHFHPPTEVHFKSGERAPLLIVGAEKDHTVPASLSRKQYEKYEKSTRRPTTSSSGAAAPDDGRRRLGGDRGRDRELDRRRDLDPGCTGGGHLGVEGPHALPGGDRRNRVHRCSPRPVGPSRRSAARGRRRLVAESARAAAAELGADRAFESAEELVRDPDVDVVHICTPNHLHLPLAEAALAAGKHVICEKPLALDAGQARNGSRGRGRRGAGSRVPFVYRYYPTVREARERVERARPDAAAAARHLSAGLAPSPTTTTGAWTTLGGASRAFADIGSHWCDLAEFVSGHRITRLSARMLTAVPERVGAAGRKALLAGPRRRWERAPVTTEDAVVVQFETDAGAIGATSLISQISAGRKNRLWIELDGAEETLRLRPGAARRALVWPP